MTRRRTLPGLLAATLIAGPAAANGVLAFIVKSFTGGPPSSSTPAAAALRACGGR